jgi:hypothetical protein
MTSSPSWEAAVVVGSETAARPPARGRIHGGIRKGGDARKCIERYHHCMQTGESTAVTAGIRGRQGTST